VRRISHSCPGPYHLGRLLSIAQTSPVFQYNPAPAPSTDQQAIDFFSIHSQCFEWVCAKPR